jgi:hypothetical protein
MVIILCLMTLFSQAQTRQQRNAAFDRMNSAIVKEFGGDESKL